MKILVTDPIVSQGITIFREAGFEVLEIPFKNTDAVLAALPGVDAWIIRSGSKVTAEHLKLAGRLKVIGRAGVGIDNVDLTAATLQGVVVMNTPNGNTISAAEHTLAMMLALVRNIPEADATLKNGGWDRKRFTGNELRGKTLGVVGLGRIGQKVIKRAQAFEMNILGYDPYVEPERIGLKRVESADLDTLLAKSDIVTLHVPKNKATENLINAQRLAQMKPGARLINCARGGLVDEAALADSLKNGHLAGAAIDVFVNEPPDDSTLRTAPHAILTPHLGASTVEAGESVAVQVCQQVKDYLVEKKLANAVNVPIADLSILKQIESGLNLVKRMGYMLHHLMPGAIRECVLTYGGEASHTQPLLLSALQGLLKERHDGELNLINVRSIAEQQGIDVVTVNDPRMADFTHAISLHLKGADGTACELVGYTDQEGIGRITRLDGFKIDSKPDGVLLLIENDDIPGVVGRVGTLLGTAQVNISGIALSRDKTRKSALSIVRCDQEVREDVLENLRSEAAIRRVIQII
ncbi:MAG: phosphoglycerate dehydrogenase [Candidatus Marinimicrobia bacterium]|nr:phosphoglycerate dehydrogenase [Candidatus Neomarinimicrobiota bacterium]MCF7840234.1 phosphoglycerate dehydrogenase [Candidatus Neomarinimicrobiota bacterium]